MLLLRCRLVLSLPVLLSLLHSLCEKEMVVACFNSLNAVVGGYLSVNTEPPIFE